MERFADEVLMNAIGVMKTMNDCYGELTEPFDIVRYKFLQELKEYRDTGLAPEQVRKLLEEARDVPALRYGKRYKEMMGGEAGGREKRERSEEGVSDAVPGCSQSGEADRRRDYSAPA